ncbi:penicillin-binding protein activator [Thiomicrorhabdus cannonii]|uniref:penicillin-binding protein activator n=1 Tax=Thiomicrorhabdus cannonii TaxID=2748011 RepID=UPI0015B9005F|nr:penicillin-binding protein activator [Thiomicrorhabdus cannonii]
MSGCSAPQPKPQQTAGGDLSLPKTTAKSEREQALKALEAQVNRAKAEEDWSAFVTLGETLWRELDGDADNQAAVEYMLWKTLQTAFDTPQKRAKMLADPVLATWQPLLNASEQPNLFARQSLADLAEFNPQAIYTRHLIPALREELKTPPQPKQIAVLLPFKGKYHSISQQIRNGLLKAYMISNRQIALRFYDTSDAAQTWARYQQAKAEGADWVIGPLTKEAIDVLAQHNVKDVLALNSTEKAPFYSFNYRSDTEAYQIRKQLEARGFARIGILSSETSRDSSNAFELRAQWLNNPSNRADLVQYPLKNPNLRQALGQLIHEEESEARYNNLRWLLGAKPEFFPRIRQDLQAIVLMGNAEQVAVFHPQFEFFQLKLPVYATANLTPANLQAIKANRDLSDVVFPTIPAIFTAHALETPLEAFGWDSFLISTQLANLAPNLCLTSGQSGILYKDGLQIDKKLIWAHYNKNGQLVRWVPPVVIPAATVPLTDTDLTPQDNNVESGAAPADGSTDLDPASLGRQRD